MIPKPMLGIRALEKVLTEDEMGELEKVFACSGKANLGFNIRVFEEETQANIVICRGFNWSHSPQGGEYWSKIYDKCF